MDKISALKKLAYDEDNNTAGIGTWNQNALGRAERVGNEGWAHAPLGQNTIPNDKNSYYAKLLSNARKDPLGSTAALNVLDGVAPRIYEGEEGQDAEIQQPELEEIRATQAEHAAQRYFDNNEAIKRYLTEAGRQNQRSFTKDMNVPYRPIDLPKLMQYLKGKKISPEQLKQLHSIQNSMVRARQRARQAVRA